MSEDIPFTRTFSVSELRDRKQEIVLTANAREREALAQFYKLDHVASLAAGFNVEKYGRHGLSVTGWLRATVAPICVVTLEPFETEINEAIETRFEPQSRRPRTDAEEEVLFHSLPEDEPPDPIIDGKVDLGALAAEYLALGLDPYPKKPGVEFAGFGEPEAQDEKPFARLKDSLAMKGNKI